MAKYSTHALTQAVWEIRHLRRRNEMLEAQMHVVEIFGAALLGRPSDGMGHGEDVAARLEKLAAEMERDNGKEAEKDQARG